MEKMDNPTFVEEIPSYEVDEDDFYQLQQAKKRRILFVILFFILLLLLTGLFYFYLYREQAHSNNDSFVLGEDVLVVHSKTDFGDTVESFKGYSSLNKAYAYDFRLENKDNVSIPYMIYVLSLDKTTIDLTSLSYAVFKNDELLFQGKFSSDNQRIVVDTLQASAIDRYSLRLWSSDAGVYQFKINVEV